MTNGWNRFAPLTPPRDPARAEAALRGGAGPAPCWWAAGCNPQLPQPRTEWILQKGLPFSPWVPREAAGGVSFVRFEDQKVLHGGFSLALGESQLRIAAQDDLIGVCACLVAEKAMPAAL